MHVHFQIAEMWMHVILAVTSSLLSFCQCRIKTDLTSPSRHPQIQLCGQKAVIRQEAGQTPGPFAQVQEHFQRSSRAVHSRWEC